MIIHVIHVAGTQIKSWGLDGLSRGDLLEGMMAGEGLFSFVPLARGVGKRSKGRVGKWVRSWWKDSEGEKHWGNMALT